MGSCELEVTPSDDASARITLLALQRLVANARALHAAQIAESERSALWPDPLPEQQLGFVCASEAMLDLMRTTRRVASSNITVLITGETGTGKELLARAIHQCSQRSAGTVPSLQLHHGVARHARQPAVRLPSRRVHRRTGRVSRHHPQRCRRHAVPRRDRRGRRSTCSPSCCASSSRARCIRWASRRRCRSTSASSRPPTPISTSWCAEGKFREDLFYRLNVVRLTIPPLRERREEIPLLLDHFLERSLKEAGKTGRADRRIDVGVPAASTPGRATCASSPTRSRRMVALAESGSIVMPEHLSPKIAATRRTVPASERPLEPTELVVRRDQPLSAAVEHVERALIQDALQSTSNVELAARAARALAEGSLPEAAAPEDRRLSGGHAGGGAEPSAAGVSRRPPPGTRRGPSACRGPPARWRAASDRR